MILRLHLNEMDLQRREHPFSLCQRQPDHPRSMFGHCRPPADFMNASGPIGSGQFQHDPPLHPALPVATTRPFHGTPTFWTVSAMIAEQGRLAWQTATDYGRRLLVETTMNPFKAMHLTSRRHKRLPPKSTDPAGSLGRTRRFQLQLPARA